MTISIENVFYNLLRMTRGYEDAPNWANGLKLGEECGEVQEAILIDNGFLGHKDPANANVLLEIADVMNVCCAILTATYPDLSPEEIQNELAKALSVKGNKYASILGAPAMSNTVQFTSIEEQMKLLGVFVEEQLGERASVCVYQDGSCTVETEVTPDKAGRGFGFDKLEYLIDNIRKHRHD